MLDHRMDLAVSAYRMKWSDIQQHVTLPCGVGVDTNTGNATSKGLELEGRARVIAALTVDFEVTYAIPILIPLSLGTMRSRAIPS